MIKKNLLCFDISQEDINIIVMTLERDAEFLMDNGLMDYSLLVGVEKIAKMNIDNISED